MCRQGRCFVRRKHLDRDCKANTIVNAHRWLQKRINAPLPPGNRPMWLMVLPSPILSLIQSIQSTTNLVSSSIDHVYRKYSWHLDATYIYGEVQAQMLWEQDCLPIVQGKSGFLIRLDPGPLRAYADTCSGENESDNCRDPPHRTSTLRQNLFG